MADGHRFVDIHNDDNDDENADRGHYK